MTKLLNLLLDAEVFKEYEYKEAIEQHPSMHPIIAMLSMGYGSEEDVFKISKNKLKIPAVTENELNNVSASVIDLVPKDMVKKYAVLPFSYDGHYLKVAMCDPTDDTLLGELAFFTDAMIIPFVALPSVLVSYINRYYALDLPETFKYGINQHLKEKYSKENMLSESFELSTTSSPSTGKPPIPKITSKKPPIPNVSNKLKSKKTDIDLPDTSKTEDTLSFDKILLSTNKDELFSAINSELSKMDTFVVLLFVRGEFLQAVASSKSLENNFTVDLKDNSVFRDVMLNQDVYTGPPYMNYIMKDFIKKTNTDEPKNILLIPLVYKDMVFAELYSDSTEGLSTLLHLKDAIVKAFTKLVEA